MHLAKNLSEATKDEIAVCAYFIWEQEGKPLGRALDHWLQAELQLAASLWHESLTYQEGTTSNAADWNLLTLEVNERLPACRRLA